MSKRFDSHPYIGSLIRIRDQLHNTLFHEEQYMSGLKQMVGILSILNPEDMNGKGREMRNRAMAEWDTLIRMQSLSGRERRVRDNAALYLNWYEEINALLWSKDYFQNQKYGMFYPSEMEK